MKTGPRVVRTAVLLMIALWSVTLSGGPVVEVVERIQRSGGGGAGVALDYDVVVLSGVGWRPEQVERAIRESASIYARCGIAVDAVAIHRVRAPRAFRQLDEAEQVELLAGLPSGRPLAIFVDRTTAGDIAYSYRLSDPVAERGTAWITRNAATPCVGVLLAHELGHILLDTVRHSSEPGNLMSYTCTHSNLAGATPSARLSEQQCRRLRGER